MLYNGVKLLQSDLLYKKPDSHVEITNETLPDFLIATKNEFDHIQRNKIELPVEIRLTFN